MTSETITINDTVAFASLVRKHLVCTFGQTSISLVNCHGHPSLFVFKAGASEATVYKYETSQERENVMLGLRHVAQGGGDNMPPDMGVTANLRPLPPSAPAANAHALPASRETGLL